jgi:hypothetical protein
MSVARARTIEAPSIASMGRPRSLAPFRIRWSSRSIGKGGDRGVHRGARRRARAVRHRCHAGRAGWGADELPLRRLAAGTEIEAYGGTPGAMARKMIEDGTSVPIGDPAKMAAIIIASVDDDPAPSRLVVGSDSYFVHQALTDRLAALESRRTLPCRPTTQRVSELPRPRARSEVAMIVVHAEYRCALDAEEAMRSLVPRRRALLARLRRLSELHALVLRRPGDRARTRRRRPGSQTGSHTRNTRSASRDRSSRRFGTCRAFSGSSVPSCRVAAEPAARSRMKRSVNRARGPSLLVRCGYGPAVGGVGCSGGQALG